MSHIKEGCHIWISHTQHECVTYELEALIAKEPYNVSLSAMSPTISSNWLGMRNVTYQWVVRNMDASHMNPSFFPQMSPRMSISFRKRAQELGSFSANEPQNQCFSPRMSLAMRSLSAKEPWNSSLFPQKSPTISSDWCEWGCHISMNRTQHECVTHEFESLSRNEPWNKYLFPKKSPVIRVSFCKRALQSVPNQKKCKLPLPWWMSDMWITVSFRKRALNGVSLSAKEPYNPCQTNKIARYYCLDGWVT